MQRAERGVAKLVLRLLNRWEPINSIWIDNTDYLHQHKTQFQMFPHPFVRDPSTTVM